MVAVEVSVTGSVTVGELVTGVDVGFVAVAVIVPSGVAEIVARRVGVLKGRGLLVVVAGRLGVKVGSGLGCVVGVDVETTLAALADGKPDPIK